MKVFNSGSCRILISMGDGRNKIDPIHSLFYNFVGVNFLGKLHNSKQHIQFIKYILGDISIPSYILPGFLTSYNYTSCGHICESIELIPEKLDSIKSQFFSCDWYIFEICSLKLYRQDGYDVQFEHTNNYICSIQNGEELYMDLKEIRDKIPNDKNILFQVHFRPNIIYQDDTKKLENREIIYHTVKRFCDNNENTFIYDPSVLLQTNHSLFDGDTHFTDDGYIENFHRIYENYLSK